MQSLRLWTSRVDELWNDAPYVRIAQLDVDPEHLEEFKVALEENASASVRVESGVFALYAVARKEAPHRFLVFEIYKDEAAYNAHRETMHFRKFFEHTRGMVTSRTFVDVDPVVLVDKASWQEIDR